MNKEAEKFIGSTVMEGMISIRAVIDGGEAGINTRRITRVLYDRSKSESKMKELLYLKAKSGALGFAVEGVDASVIDGMTIGNTHGGFVAECTEREFTDIDGMNIKTDGFYVMLEGIEDPYNFGYCLRSLYAAGADGVILSPRNWMSAAGVVARASAGASELFEIGIASGERAVEKFRSLGYTVAATDKCKNSVSVYDADLRFPLLLLIGGEKRGLGHEALSGADMILMLDYGRRFPAALSAASAASIIAFEAFRQNRGRK